MFRVQEFVYLVVIVLNVKTLTAKDFWREYEYCEDLEGSSRIAACYLKEELQLFQNVKAHLEHIRLYLGVIQRHQNEVLNITRQISNKKDYLGNALNSFSLLKRTHKSWLSVVKTILSLPIGANPTRRNAKKNKWLNFYKKVESQLVQFANLTSAYRGLSRLQNVYHLTVDTLANAGLNGSLPHSVMTAEDCFEMAKFYFKREYDYLKSIQWLDVVMKKMETGPTTSVCKKDVLELYYFAYCFEGLVPEALQSLKSLHFGSNLFTPSNWLADEYDLILKYGCGMVASVTNKYKKKHIEIKENERMVNDTLERSVGLADRGLEDDKILDADNPNLLELCNYKTVNTKTEKLLRCRYVHYNKPELLIGPFKVEEYHLDPPVLMFHQVISDQEIQLMIQFAEPHMAVAGVSLDDLEDELDEVSRTSYHSWVEDTDLPLSSQLSRRSALMSGWDLFMSEPNQVASYGLAGEFRPHVDTVSSIWTSYADYSVIMYYLNDVDVGGHTIFPALNVSVKPVKGSAVMWFNRRPDGQPDEKSMHAGCPVLQGTKWVMNKWFHVRRQQFPKCDKRKNSSFRYFYL